MLMLRVLWDTGRLDEVEWLLANYPAAFNEYGYDRMYFVNTKLVRIVSSAAGEGNAELWQSLHGDLLVHNHQLTAAKVEHARLVIAELREDTNEDMTWALDFCEQICKWWTSFNQGETIDFKIEPRGLGWNHFGLPITPVENGFDYTTQRYDNFSVSFPALRFSMPHAVEAEIEMIKGDNDLLGFAIFAGPLSGSIITQNFTGGVLRFQPGIKQMVQDSLP